jgi:S1-C subfamily serine protease
MKRILLSLLTVTALLISNISFGNDLTNKLQDASVTIKAGSSQGSGVFITRTIEGRDVTFIITAGHVIDHLKRTRIEIKDGKEMKVVGFDDVGLVQEFQQDGRKVGETSFVARVL